MTQRLSLLAASSAVLLLATLFGACGPTRSKCATVTCDGNRVCDEATGACLPTDGGVVADAGVPDAGGADGGLACTPACVSPLVCDTSSGRCVECFTDADCACPTTRCDTAAGQCVLPDPDAGLTVPPGGETCTTAPALNTCGQAVTFTADQSAARDDTVGSCGAEPGGGKDLWWGLTLSATFDVQVTARPSAASQAQPVISLRRGCDADAELACRDGLGGAASFRVKSLPAGSYALIVDGYDAAASGRVDVTVELLPPTLPSNEACGTAADLAVDTDVTVDLSTADDDVQVTCNTVGGSPEVVYRLDLPAAGDVFVTATGEADAGVDPVLALRRAPCAAADEAACVDFLASGTETLTARNLEAGRYFVVVENYGRPAAAPVTVRASVGPPTPPPANDTCAAPRAITFPAGMNSVTFTTDTSLALDDTAAGCNTEAGSPETVWALTLGTTQRVTVAAQASAGAATDPVVYLRGTACDEATGMELACADVAPPGPDTFSLVLDPGTYFLFVEGFGAAGAGPTDVTVTLGP